MDAKSINAFLILVIIILAIFVLTGRLELADLSPTRWLPENFSKSSLRWRLGWMALGAAVGFVFMWGNKMKPEKALWAAIFCGVLAWFLL